MRIQPRGAHLFGLGGMTAALAIVAAPASGQVDSARARTWFREAAALCERDGGRLWGVSLCGPIVIADAATRTIATSQPPPDAPRPAVLGFANAALPWGGERWATLVWRMIPDNERQRAVLMIHELFHRVQPGLRLMLAEPDNGHLDTVDGRYWLQLEWRALADALGADGAAREGAVRAALAFRGARREHFPGAADHERRLEINEGLAQYTGTVVAAGSAAEAAASAAVQLQRAAEQPTYVRTFAYASGAAWGVLLDGWDPGWTRRFRPTDDLAELVRASARLEPAGDARAAAARYGGAELRAAEERREVERQAMIADYRRRFVEGPVLVVPNGRSNSFTTTGMMSLGDDGTMYPTYRTNGDWGSLEASFALVSPDRSTVAVPAPQRVEGTTITGDGWTLTLQPGWVVQSGERSGDWRVAREAAREP